MSGREDDINRRADADDAPRTRGAKPGAPEATDEAYTSTPTASGLAGGNPADGPAKVKHEGPSQADTGRSDRPLLTPEELNATPPHGDVTPPDKD